MELLLGLVAGVIASVFFVGGFHFGKSTILPEKPKRKRVEKAGWIPFKQEPKKSAGYRAFSPEDELEEDSAS